MTQGRAIFLCGFMGAGKSSVGSALAERLGWRFLDTDRLIEEREGTTVRELFTQKGEPTFRAIEKRVIAETVSASRTVVSLGGGALLDPDTLQRVRSDGRLVYLSARVETLLARLAGEIEQRPLLAGLDEAARRARIAELLSARAPVYRQAMLEIATDDGTPQQIAERVAAALRTDGS